MIHVDLDWVLIFSKRPTYSQRNPTNWEDSIMGYLNNLNIDDRPTNDLNLRLFFLSVRLLLKISKPTNTEVVKRFFQLDLEYVPVKYCNNCLEATLPPTDSPEMNRFLYSIANCKLSFETISFLQFIRFSFFFVLF